MTDGRTLRVLVIAPEIEGLPRLAQWDEIGQIGDIPGVRVETVGGPRVRLDQIADRLCQPHEVVVWSGHGQAGELATYRGAATGEWLAVQLKQNAPRVAILAACYSAGRTGELRSVAEPISMAGINVIGMATRVDDVAAVAYDTEFVRSLAAGGDVGQAHLIGLQQMRCVNAESARGVFLLPGLANGYGLIEKRLGTIEGRLDRIETKLVGLGDVLDVVRSVLGQGKMQGN